MANANTVQKNIRRALRESKEGRVEAGATDELMSQVGADGMNMSNFKALLCAMRQHREVRAFGLSKGSAYIQA